VKRFTKAALGSLAGSALVLAGTQVAGASTTYRYVDKLGDFAAEDGPFDSTTGKVTIVENDDGTTTFSIKITGIGISAAGQEFGAHLHTGPCVDGDYANPSIQKNAGSLAGPHYNADIAAGVPAAEVVISPDTEVWFELIPSKEDGAARDRVTVPFVPVDLDGVMSIVIHADHTNQTTGLAGARQACFPLSVPQWKPTV
jgi:Cu-Zn family superoxide dismutase